MKIVIFGLTITSSWGNGHATTFRSLVKALHARGHAVVFVEKDVEWYRNNRDLPRPPYCTVRLYEDWVLEKAALLATTEDADCIVIGSYFLDATAVTDELLQLGRGPVLFYDIDTPVTLAALRAQGAAEYLLASHIPHYAAYLSFSGGPALQELKQRFHSPRPVPFYCSVDPHAYHAVAAKPQYRADLSYLGTYAADRQAKLMLYLNDAAGALPHKQFLVAGPQYPAITEWAANVQRIDHLPPPEHPAFYCSARFSLNLTRSDMVAMGYSPSVRLFEASACGAAILSDAWAGMEEFLTPGEEVVLLENREDVPRILAGMSDAERQAMGLRARERILAEHTADHRAAQFEDVVSACTGSGADAVRKASASEAKHQSGLAALSSASE